MRNVSSWRFSAPLAKVDVPRIVNEAAESVGAVGVIKVVVSLGDGTETGMVLADSDVACAAAHYRGVRYPDSVLCYDSKLRRGEFGGILSGPHTDASSPEGMLAILAGGVIVLYKCANEQEADQLVGKLVDRVVVNVEVF